MPVAAVSRPPIRVRSAPPLDPPFDDEVTAPTWAGPGMGQLALDWPAEHGSAAADGSRAAALPRPPGDRAAPDGRSAAGRRNPGDLCSGPAGGSAAAWEAARRFLRTCLEILNGFRPTGHLRPLTNPADAARVIEQVQLARDRMVELRRRGPGRGRRGAPPDPAVLRRLRLCEPRPGVAEVAVVLRAGDRAVAVAFRLERQRGRWLCTTITTI